MTKVAFSLAESDKPTRKDTALNLGVTGAGVAGGGILGGYAGGVGGGLLANRHADKMFKNQQAANVSELIMRLMLLQRGLAGGAILGLAGGGVLGGFGAQKAYKALKDK